jgi:hypothetical protein
MSEKNETTSDQLPDRLLVDPNSPYYNAEYCISQRWVRVTGAAKDCYGNRLTMRREMDFAPFGVIR